MTRIDIATLFPEMCEGVLGESIIGRARKNGKIIVNCHNIRDYSEDKHRRVDDTVYGGGMGMLMQCEPIFKCYEEVKKDFDEKPYVVYMSPQANPLTQKKVIELKENHKNFFIICGHYEGIDARVIEEIVDEEISIGDFVLTGGELAALVFVDALGRICDGVLSSDECFEEESHFGGLLEYPQYTRPPVWHEKEVPEILLSGHHANIKKWRHEQALLQTAKKRPDMLEKYTLSKDDKKFLGDISEKK
ncbi:MAG: tRNA (guanosine(37)-N1)-methyltransferase TrmD [Oscillospiraceae bacterium]